MTTVEDVQQFVSRAQRAQREIDKLGAGSPRARKLEKATAERDAAVRRLADQERHNIASRRSLVEQSDRYVAKLDEWNKFKVWLMKGLEPYSYLDDVNAADILAMLP